MWEGSVLQAVFQPHSVLPPLALGLDTSSPTEGAHTACAQLVTSYDTVFP